MIVVVEVPFATIELEAAAIVDVAALAGPAIKVTVSVSTISVLPSFPVMAAVPTEVLEVNVAVYVPLPLSVTDDSEPRVVVNVGVQPLVVILFPSLSFN